MNDRPLAPTFPNEPLRPDELRLRKAKKPKPIKERRVPLEQGAHVGQHELATCTCGSTRVHRVQDVDNDWCSWLRCFDCWRKW